MAGTAADVIAAARSHIGQAAGQNDCAKAVSAWFREGGAPGAFSGSTWVPSIVAQFSGAKVSTDLATALTGDLIVFGPDKKGLDGHIGVYTGSGMVVNTNGYAPNTKVQEQAVKDIVTDAGTGFSKVLHTGLVHGILDLGSNPGEKLIDPLGRIQGNLQDASAALFGSMFGWVPMFAANGAVLVLVLVLATVGIRQVVDSSG